MTKKNTYTRAEMLLAIENSKSIKDVICYLGLTPNSGQYRHVKAKAEAWGLQLPKISGSQMTARARYRNTQSNEVFFSSPSVRHGPDIRKRLLKLGFQNICSICGLEAQWNNKPLTLQIDHIDGCNVNNNIENLRIICPNCHTQTPTYGNGIREKEVIRDLCSCGAVKLKRSSRCRPCSNKINSPKHEWASIDKIISYVQLYGFRHAGRIMGVSDNAIRKHLQKAGIDWRHL